MKDINGKRKKLKDENGLRTDMLQIVMLPLLFIGVFVLDTIFGGAIAGIITSIADFFR